MKIDGAGEPANAARTSAQAADPFPAARPPQRRRWAALILCLALVLTVIFAGHAVIGFILTRTLSVALGERIQVDSFRLGGSHSEFVGLRVGTGAGDPLFDAGRVTLDYSLWDLVRGRGNRYGLRAVSLERPQFTLVRHADGSYNLGSAGRRTGGATSASGGPPLRLRLDVHDGSVRLVDRGALTPDLSEQVVGRVELDARIATDGRSEAHGHATYAGRRSAGARMEDWPLELGGFGDVERGMAFVRLRAATLPLRGGLGFLVHSPAVRIDDGILRDLELKLYALNLGLQAPADIHVGGRADLADGRLSFGALREPIRRLTGRLSLTDDGVWSTRLRGTLGRIPVVARGGAYNRAAPTLRLGLRADADLSQLRTLFGFSRTQPVAGSTHVETLIEAPVADILIRTSLRVPHGSYGAVPLGDVAGRVDYHASSVVLDAVHGRYGAATLGVGGRFLLSKPYLDSAIAVSARASGRAIPYLENLAPEAGLDALALITSGPAGFRARGALGALGDGVEGRAMFAVDERGVGEFGPITFARRDGSSLVGALRLERPTSQSAGWVSARGYRIAIPSAPSGLPGLNVPAFPPLAGVLDAALAGGGSPDHFALAGRVVGRELQVGTARLGSGSANLGGSLGDVRLADVALDGNLGRFRGGAAAGDGTFALRGAYEGSLERLIPLTGQQNAHGTVHGPLAAQIASRDVVVQSTGAVLTGGRVRGVGLDSAAGTLAVRGGAFHLVTGDGTIGGRRAVARESTGAIAVSAPDLPSAALRGAGSPLDEGNVSVFGLADLRGTAPTFMGTVNVTGGRVRGFAVAGDARIALAGARATIATASGALGSTYGSFGGSIAGIGGQALRYDLDTRVKHGDIAVLRRDLNLPVRYLDGSFDADLHIRGAGTHPVVDGLLRSAEGRYNGLAFRDAQARLALDAGSVAAQDGRITVGSTRATVDARAGGGGFSFAASSAQADLADFNDFFDAGDTLAGRGRVAIAFGNGGRHIETHGSIDMTDLRYRAFALGATAARWQTSGGGITGSLSAAGPTGTAQASGRIVPAGVDDLRNAFSGATYDMNLALARVDLGTWLPAAGYTEPVLGKVDATAHIRGRFPQLAVSLDATLADATVAGFPVRNATLRATGAGSRVDVVAANANLDFGAFSAAGRLGLAAHDALAFDIRATTPDAGRALRAFVPAMRGLDVAGALDATVRLSGTQSHPQVAGGFELTNARYGTFAVPRTIGALALNGTAIELRDVDVEFTRGQAFVAGSLPLQISPFGLGPPHAPLSFDLTARGVDLAQFSALFPAGTKLGGTVDGRFGVEGSVDRPRLLGSLAIVDGSYLSAFERAPIQHFNARLAFAGTSVALETFHAGVGDGTLDAGGRISLPFGDSTRTSYALDVEAKAARLDFPAYGRGTIDGRLRLTGGADPARVSGTVALRDAVIPVAAVYGSGPAARTPATAGSGGPVIDPVLAIAAKAGNNVRLRNGIVDVGLTGGVDVSGTLRTPRLAGGFTATDGTISSYNHIFRLVNASATFNPADGLLPTIDARATSRVTNPDPDPSRNIAGSANITVTVSGTPDSNNLQVVYSSDPPYSQEQIVGLLLDVPALLGAVNFNLNGPGATLLRGAPGETNALLPPGVTPEQVSAISFNQEVFSLLNGQFTQRALTPIERVFEKLLGLSDLEFTVDYGGGLGYSLRREIGKRNFSAFLSQTVTYPERSNFGFELEPKPFQTLHFSYYQQNGVTSLITNQTPGLPLFSGSTRRLTSVQPLGNRSGFSLDFDRRF